ncbi:hypothetical protein BDR26DRAFT_859224 [Obelidium mucronatum]|nr:hypothetical protein BDR26DRAFT_859224 [Obelidium mucronatum]
MNTSPAWLPNEVLQSIFEKLDLDHLLIAGQICTQWRVNTRSNSIWRNMNISICEKGILCSASHSKRRPPTPKTGFKFSTRLNGCILSTSNSDSILKIAKEVVSSLKPQLAQIQYLRAPFHDITDAHLIQFMTHMPEITSISVERCRHLSVNVIPFIPTLCPKLTSIDLSNTYMDDAAFRFLVRNSHHLEELTLSQCPKVTDEGIIGICKIMASKIRVLKMAACFAVSKDGFRKGLANLALTGEKLEYLDIGSNAASIDYEVMMEFATLRTTKVQPHHYVDNKKLVINIMGDGWEFTKDEVESVQLIDESLNLIHNARMANHSEDGVKEYLSYLMNAY